MKLKTLNDLREGRAKRGEVRLESPGGMFIEAQYMAEERIKAEAIKWVKKDIEDYRKHLGDVVQGKEINSYTMKLINKWKERLNITEEDLKS